MITDVTVTRNFVRNYNSEYGHMCHCWKPWTMLHSFDCVQIRTHGVHIYQHAMPTLELKAAL